MPLGRVVSKRLIDKIVIFKAIKVKKKKKNAVDLPITPFSPFLPNLDRLEKVGSDGFRLLCFLFSLANKTTEIQFLPPFSFHSKHNVNIKPEWGQQEIKLQK